MIVNVVSMLYPDMWPGSRGFLHALFYYPSIWQRYLHFLFASLALMGGYLYWWGRRKERAAAKEGSPADAVYTEAKNFGKKAASLFTVVQVIMGPLVLFSLDERVRGLYLGSSGFHVSQLAITIALVLLLIGSLYVLMKTGTRRWFGISFVLFFMVIGMMGWIRHEVEDVYLQPYAEQFPRTISQADAQR